VSDRKRAIIAGIAGQDGTYLAELLLEKGTASWIPEERRRRVFFSGMKSDVILEETELVRKEDIVRWTACSSGRNLQLRGHIVRPGLLGRSVSHVSGEHAPCRGFSK